jgi:hypothetical protein
VCWSGVARWAAKRFALTGRGGEEAPSDAAAVDVRQERERVSDGASVAIVLADRAAVVQAR